MKYFLVFLLAAWSLAMLSADGDWTLIRDGRPAAGIVRPDRPLVQKSVRDFNAVLKRCTGTELPVMEEALLDQRRLNRIQLRIVPAAPGGREAFAVDFPDERTMRITGDEDAISPAFFHLLEQYAGVRWLFPPVPEGIGDLNEYPKTRALVFPRRNFRSAPAMNLYRALDWRMGEWKKYWNLQSSPPSHFLMIDAFPIARYGPESTWPEEILPVRNGKKFRPKPTGPVSQNPYAASGLCQTWAPCFSHPSSARIAADNILELLRREQDRKDISLEITDTGNHCECGSCRKKVRSRRNSGGYSDYSELYWTWVNRVAEIVSEKHPGVRFHTLAYREMMDPPAFSLHPDVVVRLCFETGAMTDPEVLALREPVLDQWSRKTRNLALWDYNYGFPFYLFPRCRIRNLAGQFKRLYQYNVRGYYSETFGVVPYDGPLLYCMARLLWNPEADPAQLIREWCQAAVGLAGAPFLEEYYRFWENYWESPEIRRTQWYRMSRKNIYMQLGDVTHVRALKKGDLPRLRVLMEKVVAFAETPGQKQRAAFLMKLFEYTEMNARVLFASRIGPEGNLPSAKAAYALLKEVPAAFDALQKLESFPFRSYRPKIGKLRGALIGQIALILPFLEDSAVRGELNTLVRNENLPRQFRAILKLWMGASARNLLSNGSFEADRPLPTGWAGGPLEGRKTSQYASHGKFSLGGRQIMAEFVLKNGIRPGKTYLLLFDAFTPSASSEGRVHYELNAFRGANPASLNYFSNLTLAAGAWRLFCGTAVIPPGADTLKGIVYNRNFEQQERLFIDNVRIYCLDDL